MLETGHDDGSSLCVPAVSLSVALGVGKLFYAMLCCAVLCLAASMSTGLLFNHWSYVDCQCRHLTVEDIQTVFSMRHCKDVSCICRKISSAQIRSLPSSLLSCGLQLFASIASDIKVPVQVGLCQHRSPAKAIVDGVSTMERHTCGFLH